ncbi:MAG: hypothetical protein NVSMB18_24090 [Acetobacteraceae bacterium]
MDQLIGAFIGYCLQPQSALSITASTFVLASFAMRSMHRLRMTAIASNIAFISFGWVAHIWPIFVLHAILLPLNCIRLVQSERGKKATRSSGNGAQAWHATRAEAPTAAASPDQHVANVSEGGHQRLSAILGTGDASFASDGPWCRDAVR